MRKTETVTLHFDLSHVKHLPEDQEFTLRALGNHTTLEPHTDETRRHHAQHNRALLAMPESDLSRLTHFAQGVEVPADAVGLHWVGYPSRNPDAATDEVAAVFQHVPADAVRRAVRAMKRDSYLPVPAVLAHYGVTDLSEDDAEEFCVDASTTVNYISTALTIVMQHPEIGTLVPEQHHRIAQEIVARQSSFPQVWQYLSTHPAEGTEPWYGNTYVKDPDGKVMPPAPNLKGSDGRAVPWPTKTINGQQVQVIPQHNLSAGLADQVTPVVQEAVKVIKDTPWLKGQHWSTQHGVTQVSRSNVPPSPVAVSAPRLAAAETVAPALSAWTIASKTAHFGLDLYPASVKFDEVLKTLSFDVRNWPNRGLGVYVQFLDAANQPIDRPASWQDQLPAGFLQKWLEPNNTKMYLQHIGAGLTFFGAPLLFLMDPLTLSFEVPDSASGANVLIGGMGNGYWDMDVDWPGLIYTSLLSYGLPSLLCALSVGVQGRKWYMEFFSETRNVILLLQAASPILGLGAYAAIEVIGLKAFLVRFAEFAVGILLGSGLSAFALKLTGYVTAMELADNAPMIGWGLRVAGQTAAIADMVATSVEVALSPATYSLDVKRSMTLNVNVNPDPTHGTKTQKPIWPQVSDHFVLSVQYKGGTTLRKSGPMPGQEDASISVSFATATGDALPSAPGQQFQIIADIYSASNWLCGKWVSGWIQAVPTDGSARTETGSIIEQLVPLTAATTYSHEAKLDYDGTSRSYVWEKTIFSISDTLESSFVAGLTPQPVEMPSGPVGCDSRILRLSRPGASRVSGRSSTRR